MAIPASYTGTPPVLWTRYGDDTCVKILKSEIDPFFKHINEVDEHIEFTEEEASNNKLAFLDVLCTINEDESVSTSVYRKKTHTDQYLLFESHHPLVHKLGVVRTLDYRANTIVSTQEEQQKEKTHIETALSQCGYPRWAFHLARKPKDKTKENSKSNQHSDSKRKVNITIPYVEGISEKIRRVFEEYGI